MVQVLVGLPQADGSLLTTEKIMVNLINRPSISSISPLKGFALQGRDIKIVGNNFYNLDTLHVKAVFQNNAPDLLLDCLTVTTKLVIVKAPNANNIPFYADRTMKLLVSSNGMDYSLESIFYTYMDEPHITSLTQAEADYQGNIPTEVLGKFFTSDITN